MCRLAGILFALLISAWPGLAASQVDEGPIRVLMIGQVFPYETPVAGWLEDDPAFDYVVVPVRRDTGGWTNYPEKEAKRYVRLYFPRNYEALVQYEFLCYVDTYFAHLTGTQINDMYMAIRDSGLGGLTTLGGGISWVLEFRQSWESSRVGSAFPTEYIQLYDKIEYVTDFTIEVAKAQSVPPVFKPFLSLEIEKHRGRQAAELNAKEGSTVYATMNGVGSKDMPFAVAWTYGEGTTWSVATDIQSNYNLWWTRWGAADGYRYAGDLFLNMIIHSMGREPIQDILRFHGLRQQFSDYREMKSMLHSLLDFVEAFGANRRELDEEMESIEHLEEKARMLYREQDLDGAAEMLHRVFEELDRVSDLSIKLKDQALLWIYIVEWLAVSATLMISGSLLWTLMVRRRMYRYTGTTRMR